MYHTVHGDSILYGTLQVFQDVYLSLFNRNKEQLHFFILSLWLNDFVDDAFEEVNVTKYNFFIIFFFSFGASLYIFLNGFSIK